MRNAFLLAFAAALGCTSQVIIGTAECNTLYGGCGTGGTTTVFGGAGYTTTTYSEPIGTFTVTDTVTVSSCGTAIVWCSAGGPQCDCWVSCAQGELEAQCSPGSASEQECECLNSGTLVDACTGPLPTIDPYVGCGQAGLGCCDAVFGVSM